MLSGGTATAEVSAHFMSNGRARQIGLALSGGGSRAVAFHLGCLRALHDRGVLEQVNVLSAVSGGSLIAALYAYAGDADFEQFDQRIVLLLRQGLMRRIAARALASTNTIGAAATTLTSGVAAVTADFARFAVSGFAWALGSRSLGGWATHIQPPLRRFTSRTDAFLRVLESLFERQMMKDVRRPNLHVVLNACELRSGSAFRFGSKESGCWRYGLVCANAVSVAEAVTASAAYPVFLPALDRVMRFQRPDGDVEARVLLTDGGVFENLGVSCLEPGRSDSYSSNVFPVDYIISLDAGQGLFDVSPVPYWWPSRMSRSFESVFRKVQNATYSRLHKYVESGDLSGAVMVYLGQRDASLPLAPPGLVPRDAVKDYPTDFAAMPQRDIELLTSRGEQLTRLLLAHYCPEL